MPCCLDEIPGMLLTSMRPPGAYKIASRNRAFDAYLDPGMRCARRVARIVDSLRQDILEDGSTVRLRQIFRSPREIWRLELNLPQLGYQRTTLLDREALESLLEAEEVRARVRSPLPPG